MRKIELKKINDCKELLKTTPKKEHYNLLINEDCVFTKEGKTVGIYIKIDNEKVNFNDFKKNDLLRAKKIGIIYQQDNLLNDFTAFENIYLASLAAGNNKKLSIIKTEVLLKKINLLNRSEHYPSQLSGGEKQRISIARAILKETPIILLDEATSSLDAETENKIQKGLSYLTKNKTTLVIAHRLSTILSSEKIFVIDKGDLVSEGTHEELLNKSSIYKNFYKKQITKS